MVSKPDSSGGETRGRCCCRVKSHLGEHGDALERLRIFVEHVSWHTMLGWGECTPADIPLNMALQGC